MSAARLGAATAVGLALSTAAIARAEPSPASAVAQLMIVEPGDESHRLFHGAVWLDADKVATNYRWGGLHCKGRELSDTSVQLLYAAMRSDYIVQLEYVVSPYQDKQYRCVTSVTISKV
ncbi:MAG: hypothetical protein R2939_05325 [Kofleriaceae bacterium]